VSEVVLIHEDITEQTLADEQRREATEQLQLVIQQSGDAVIVADADGVVRIFNPAAERLYGVSGTRVHARALDRALPAAAHGRHAAPLRGDGASTGPYAASSSATSGGRCSSMTEHAAVERHRGAARTADGRPAGRGADRRDETVRLAAELERERLLDEMRRAHRQVEAASRMKDEFLATLSHELRTPLNAILGWTRILRTRSSAADAAHPLEVIERNATAQARLIDDLLDMSRIVTGKIALRIGPVDLGQVAAAAVETVRPAADARGVGLIFDAPTPARRDG
jgi:signal transduction histidine kinase